MNPYYFGDSEKRLFGIYYPASSRRDLGTAVLLCYPVGQEYIRSHRAFLQLSIMLSRAGFHVFRFDYFATGDSSGESRAGNVDQWKADIHTAVDELKATSGVTKISIVGLRLGAVLAAEAVSDGIEVTDLVLWDPIVIGKQYINDLQNMQRDLINDGDLRISQKMDEGLDPTDELIGFPYPAILKAGIEQLDLLHIRECSAKRILLVTSEEKNEYRLLWERLNTIRNPVEYSIVSGEPGWIRPERHDAVLMPYELLRTITAKLTRGAL